MLFISLFFPTYHYFRMNQLANYPTGMKDLDFEPELTIVLPMRNESSNVVRKIDEVATMDYPQNKISLMVIDSGSTDNTAQIAYNHLSSFTSFKECRVITLEIPGKSVAVNHALQNIDTDFFIMMDSDSSCAPDSIRKLTRWFSDNDSVGAVCGQLAASINSKEFPYRSRFNTIRVGESIIDSTPIFEGSLCAFRLQALGTGGINQSVNADDSQMAMLSRSHGYRSIMDPEILFKEPQVKNTRFRMIRRAQGLIRALLLNRRLCFGYGSFSKIMINAIYFYTIFPFLFFSSIFLISKEIFYNFQSDSMLTLSNVLLISIICPIFLTRTGRNLILGSSVLIEAQFKILLGKTYEIWEPIREN